MAASLNMAAAMKVALAGPGDAKLNLPGLALARSMNSLTDFAGESGGTIRTTGTDATGVTPEKSFTGSKVRLLLMTPAMV